MYCAKIYINIDHHVILLRLHVYSGFFLIKLMLFSCFWSWEKLFELSFVLCSNFWCNNDVAGAIHCLYWVVTTPTSAQSLGKATHHNIYLPHIPWLGFARDPWTARLKYALQNIDVKCPGDVDFGFGNLVERLRSAPSLQARCEWQPLGLNKLNTAKALHLLTSAQL